MTHDPLALTEQEDNRTPQQKAIDFFKSNTGIAIIAGLILLILGGYLVGVYNTCISHEAGLDAAYTRNKNIYSIVRQNIRGQGKVAVRYEAGVLKTIKASLEGRYGKRGITSPIALVKEHNKGLSPKMFEAVQLAIAAGTTRFGAGQTDLIDRARVYRKYLQSVPSGLLAKLFGFPTKPLSKYTNIVLTDETREVFKTKKDKPINAFDSK